MAAIDLGFNGFPHGGGKANTGEVGIISTWGKGSVEGAGLDANNFITGKLGKGIGLSQPIFGEVAEYFTQLILGGGDEHCEPRKMRDRFDGGTKGGSAYQSHRQAGRGTVAYLALPTPGLTTRADDW